MFRHESPRTQRVSAACAVLGLGALALAFPAPMRAQVGPEESARKVKPADGLVATLWAAEPMDHNPTNMDIDSREGIKGDGSRFS